VPDDAGPRAAVFWVAVRHAATLKVLQPLNILFMDLGGDA